MNKTGGRIKIDGFTYNHHHPWDDNMAAMVERPLSVLNDMPTLGPSSEIIDVDAFEDEGLNLNLISEEELPLLTQPVSRPLDRGSRRPTPQTIYLLDSDDDDLLVASGSGSNSNLGELTSL
jgi:hypothetical protein